MPALPPTRLLHPRPQEIIAAGEGLHLRPDTLFRVRADDGAGETAREWLLAQPRIGARRAPAPAGAEAGSVVTIRLRAAAPLDVPAGGYRLGVGADGIEIEAEGGAALFHGACTAAQLIDLSGEEAGSGVLPGLVVRDWPDLPQRGVLLDVSRDKVPTMETLLSLVELLARWKVNQLQLYIEHTFAYRGHEAVWRDASPLSGDEIQRLDEFCRARFIELVPNQNSFGHMHRWLIHEPYRRLAESPDGIEHPFSREREPYSLCPVDAGSLELLGELYDQLLPHFSSRRFNVGLDETFDLGLGRSAAECARVGTERVYLDFLESVHRLVRDRGRSMQFWSDIVRASPELIGELPPDVTALDWGYEADHPFETSGREFRKAGLDYYVCPGTSSWNSIAGRTTNAIANLTRAAASARAHSASGWLVTDWGDCGHLQPLPVSYLGLMVGAGLGWNDDGGFGDPSRVAALLDAHVFRDRAARTGRVAYELGDVYRRFGTPRRNASPIFDALVHPERTWGTARDGDRGSDAAAAHGAIDEAVAGLAAARMERPDAELIAAEFRWAADVLRLGVRLGAARSEGGAASAISALPGRRRRPLGRELAALAARHRAVWTRRNRPGGLEDSVAWLTRALPALEA